MKTATKSASRVCSFPPSKPGTRQQARVPLNQFVAGVVADGLTVARQQGPHDEFRRPYRQLASVL